MTNQEAKKQALTRRINAKKKCLTARETQVLKLKAEGLTSAQVGSNIGCAKATVDLHLANAYRVLGVKNCTAAVSEAKRLKLI